jgi:arginyl-tRNA synthetase
VGWGIYVYMYIYTYTVVLSVYLGKSNHHQLYTYISHGLTQIYDMLNIQGLKERGESFYNPYLNDVVQDLENMGLAVKSEGATAVFLEGVSNKWTIHARCLFGPTKTKAADRSH